MGLEPAAHGEHNDVVMGGATVRRVFLHPGSQSVSRHNGLLGQRPGMKPKKRIHGAGAMDANLYGRMYHPRTGDPPGRKARAKARALYPWRSTGMADGRKCPPPAGMPTLCAFPRVCIGGHAASSSLKPNRREKPMRITTTFEEIKIDAFFFKASFMYKKLSPEMAQDLDGKIHLPFGPDETVEQTVPKETM